MDIPLLSILSGLDAPDTVKFPGSDVTVYPVAVPPIVEAVKLTTPVLETLSIVGGLGISAIGVVYCTLLKDAFDTVMIKKSRFRMLKMIELRLMR